MSDDRMQQKMPKNLGEELDINTLTEEDKQLYLEKRAELKEHVNEIYSLLTASKAPSSLASRFLFEKNKDDLLKELTQIIGILSDLRTIVNFREEFPSLHSFELDFDMIQSLFAMDGMENLIEKDIKQFCVSANSIRFYERKKHTWIIYIYRKGLG